MRKHPRSEELVMLGAFLTTRCGGLAAAFNALGVRKGGRLNKELFGQGLLNLGYKEDALKLWPLLDPHQIETLSFEGFRAAFREFDSMEENIKAQDGIPLPTSEESSRCLAKEPQSKEVFKQALQELLQDNASMKLVEDIYNKENPELTTQVQSGSGLKISDDNLVTGVASSDRSWQSKHDFATETLASLVATIESLEAHLTSCIRTDVDAARKEWRATLKEAIAEERSRASAQYLNLTKRVDGLCQVIASFSEDVSSSAQKQHDSKATAADSSSDISECLTRIEARVESALEDCSANHRHIQLLEAHVNVEMDDLRAKIQTNDLEQLKSDVDERFQEFKTQAQGQILARSVELVNNFETRVLALVEQLVPDTKCGEALESQQLGPVIRSPIPQVGACKMNPNLASRASFPQMRTPTPTPPQIPRHLTPSSTPLQRGRGLLPGATMALVEPARKEGSVNFTEGASAPVHSQVYRMSSSNLTQSAAVPPTPPQVCRMSSSSLAPSASAPALGNVTRMASTGLIHNAPPVVVQTVFKDRLETEEAREQPSMRQRSASPVKSPEASIPRPSPALAHCSSAQMPHGGSFTVPLRPRASNSNGPTGPAFINMAASQQSVAPTIPKTIVGGHIEQVRIMQSVAKLK